MICGGSLVEKHTEPTVDGGSKPTPSLHFLEIDKKKATELIVQYHYIHKRCPITFCWGIEIGSKIVGVMTIGKPATWSTACGLVGENKLALLDPAARNHDVYELNRLWLSDDLPRNSESKFIAWCLKEFKKRNPLGILVSFADSSQGHVGYVYQATNWIYTGSSTPFTDITLDGFGDYRSVPQYLRGGFIYRCEDDGEFASSYVEDKKPVKELDCPMCGKKLVKTNRREWSSKDFVIDKDGKQYKIIRKSRTLKHRYVWFANQKDKTLLNWDILPYPKKAA